MLKEQSSHPYSGRQDDDLCYYDDENDFEEEEQKQWRAAMEMNQKLRFKFNSQQESDEQQTQRRASRQQKPSRRRKEQMIQVVERARIERENLHLVRHISELGHRQPTFSINDRYYEDRHVANSYLTRKRHEYKINRENRLITTRLEHEGGSIRSSGYGMNKKLPCGPLAEKNRQLAKRRFSTPRLQQPEMSF